MPPGPDTSPAVAGWEAPTTRRCTGAGLVVERAMRNKIAHTRSDRNPITPQTHDGMCHGVTPFFCLNDSDDRYAMYPMTRPMIKKTIALADDAVASSVMLPVRSAGRIKRTCPPVPAQGRTHGR